MYSFKIFILCNVFVLLCGFRHERGDSCDQDDDFFPGRCELFYDCIDAMVNFEKGIRPKICGFDGIMPLVCCKDKLARISSSAIRCYDYSKQQILSTRFGIKESDIKNKIESNYSSDDYSSFWDELEIHRNTAQAVGGEFSDKREFPHMAALGYGDEKNPKWMCGGTIISEEYVLTAAHCLLSQDSGPVKYVRLGDLNLYSDADGAKIQDFKVVKVHKHPGYMAPNKYHDIALIQLDKPAVFNDWAFPACLHDLPDVPNVTLTATGWGYTETYGNPSDHLVKVGLEVFTKEECSKHYKPQRMLTKGIIDENMFCAGSRTDEKGTCLGDSGGPLQMKNSGYDNLHTIIGITSFGRGCAIIEVPSVYVRVSRYVPWIENIVWKNPSKR